MKYKIETKEDLQKAIKDLGYSYSAFVRVMANYGDYRTNKGARNTLDREKSGESKIDPKTIVIINLLAEMKEHGFLPADPK